jgi:DNA processing protein
MEKQEIFYRLALGQVAGIGAKKQKYLLEHFKSAQEIFNSSPKYLKSLPFLNETSALSIKSFADFSAIEKEMNYNDKNGIAAIFFDDEKYPQRLKNCIDAPVILFYKGQADLNALQAISVIGTRSYTEYGKKVCEEFIADLENSGITVFSGLAYGIDVIAHKACLKHKLPTVGVLAHGLSSIYPPAHSGVAKEMLEHGGLLSEYFSGEKAEKGNFPTRNRIVAGISDATIVIETDLKGGSMITAEIAYSYNRDVFCFPGRTIDTKSAGCNYLIKSLKGQLITSADDVLNIMNWKSTTPKKPSQRQLFIELEPDEDKVYTALKDCNQIHIDELYQKTGMSSTKIASAMLGLEMQGIIKVLPGKMIALV